MHPDLKHVHHHVSTPGSSLHPVHGMHSDNSPYGSATHDSSSSAILVDSEVCSPLIQKQNPILNQTLDHLPSHEDNTDLNVSSYLFDILQFTIIVKFLMKIKEIDSRFFVGIKLSARCTLFIMDGFWPIKSIHYQIHDSSFNILPIFSANCATFGENVSILHCQQFFPVSEFYIITAMKYPNHISLDRE